MALQRPVQRLTDSEKPKLNYSGKKKRHTRKHLVAVNQNQKVLVLSQAREGKLHDKKFHDQEKLRLKYTCRDSDSSRQWFPRYPRISMKISAFPIKNQKGES
ncbi:transposase family protein [Okeania sp.]|uniref:transposase family protein n=1 Tax=Okeania sp. TaxID=3100323 RepID=UPI0035C8D212